ncbi:unnamed protein product [Callosobruchus maculatus]|uniref:Solute carrier family 25 member 38 n=1 Tax=Callosobruchus maculatus TaxID=64391 RepID=A0A653CV22_CALMS|nr:unnamed protein product [Callosobruchus maculatus]
MSRTRKRCSKIIPSSRHFWQDHFPEHSQQSYSSLWICRHGTVSMVSTFANILQQEHISGLWRGMVPSLTRCVPGVGLYFCFLDTMKSQYLHNRAPSALESVAMGVTARCLSSAVLIPVTVVKTSLLLQRSSVSFARNISD